LRTPLRFEDGHLLVPTAPGIGVELDEDVALRHPYDGDELHLEPVYGEVDASGDAAT
jgi:galactonate dehydratase